MIATVIGMGRGCRVDAFYRSDQGETAEKLLSAYNEGNADEIRHVVGSSYIIPHLDHMVSLNKTPNALYANARLCLSHLGCSQAHSLLYVNM